VGKMKKQSKRRIVLTQAIEAVKEMIERQSDRARLHTLAGGNPAQKGGTNPQVASHEAHALLFKKPQDRQV
jgi:hypothetical protein